MDVIGLKPDSTSQLAVAANGRDINGAPYDTYDAGLPFESAPDRDGKRHKFVICWGTIHDSSGGVVVRAIGKNADKVRGSFDNTDIYHIMRDTLGF
jgi:alkaline phosphatase